MKKLYFITLLLLLFVFKANAQCPPGNLTVTTQAQVDQFIINYPNCTSISGALQIGPAVQNSPGNITDLSALSNITSVSGNLYIQNNANLQSVDGLQIETVGGWLYIGGDDITKTNLELTNLNGLSSLTSVAEDIYISYNPMLTDISALQNTSFNPLGDYGLTIINNPALAVCNLSNLCTYLTNPAGAYPREISGNLAECVNEVAVAEACGITLCPPDGMSFTTQAQINQFVIDYPYCTEIAGYLQIHGDDITDLSPLSNINSVTGELAIYDCPVLQNVNGLSNVAEIGGRIHFGQNPQLQSIDGLSNLTNVGTSIDIWNSSLTNLDALSEITTINGYISIYNSTAITNISGLQNITSGINQLIIKGNSALSVCNLPNFCTYLANDATTHPRDISGNLAECLDEQAVMEACNILSECPTGDVELSTQAEVDQFIIDYPNCTEIQGDLKITEDVSNLNGLRNITIVRGNVRIREAGLLTSLDGLNLTEIGGYFELYDLQQLSDINALSSLTKINGPLGIAGILIENLDALSNLTEINGDLAIIGNPNLLDISGLENIDPATILDVEGIGLAITQNSLLSVCNISNLCTYLTFDETTHPRTISDNAGDCITEQAMIDACNAPAEGCLEFNPALPQWPTSTVDPSCNDTQELITDQAWTGEYSKVQLTAGVVYAFSSSVNTDYVTISDENGTTVHAFGTHTVTYTPTSDEIVRFYLHLDDQCDWGDQENRSRIIQCNTLNMSELNSSELAYYPNPVKNILNITNEQNISDVTILNLSGQNVWSKKVNAKKAEIDMTTLPSGIYIVKVKLNDAIKTIKVIKQ